MPIEQANPTDGLDLETDDDIFQEEDSEYNFRELMDQVSTNGDMIFSVMTSAVDELKQGLIKRKAKDNAKLKAAGLAVDNLALAFLVYARKDKDGKEIPGQSDVRVKLRPRKGIKILDIRVPNDEI